jgi:hypothetical protein
LTALIGVGFLPERNYTPQRPRLRFLDAVALARL